MTDTILTHDAGVPAFDGADGVVTSNDDSISFDWDEEHIVRVDAPADLEGAFDTDRFYKVEDATIARPIKQAYVRNDEVKTYKKPADALRKAAWSFDNRPFTLGHPDSGVVKNVDDIHGFWRGAHYDDEAEALKEDLYVPANDEEAMEWIEDHKDVSVGFYNYVTSDFDGDTGDLTDDDVDGFQTNIYGDHIAGVKHGRCSGEDGCGLDNDHHGSVVTDTHEMDQSAPEGTDDGPETTEDCGCDTMGDEDNDNEFDVPDLSVDALAEKNDAVAELKEDRDELANDLREMEEEIEDALDSLDNVTVQLDEDECVCEGVEALAEAADEAAAKAEDVEDLRDELEEYRADEREEALDELETLGADTDEYEDADLDALEEEIERRKEVLDAAPDVSVKDIESETDTEETNDTQSGPRQFGRGHAAK